MTENRRTAWLARLDAGESVIQIAASEGLSRARIYQVLSAAKVPQRAPPPPDPKPYKPAPAPVQRPAWSYPDAQLVALAREGRAEIEHAMQRLRDEP
jgi:hypothetical protein